MPKVQPTPFDVKLDDDQKDALTTWLCDEVQYALDARSAIIAPGGQLDYWHWLYDQGRKRTQDLPWPRAANLSSPIIPQYVDALRARFLKTIFVEPIWVVEGWGDSAAKAPLVEEFHQWKAEEERLQTWLGRAFDLSLVEGTGVLECCERVDQRVTRAQKRVAFQTDEAGRVQLDDKGQPQPQVNDQGLFTEAADDPSVPTGDVLMSQQAQIRQGPNYRCISLRDFLLMPGHAIDDSELFGYAKRFWRRLPELQARVAQGIYDQKAVDDLGTASDRTSTMDQDAKGQSIAPQRDATVEKELWEILFLRDLDGDGLEEWYVATIHLTSRTLLRVQHDDLGYPRYQLFRPDPDPQSVYGRSFVAKMAPIAEEHTAVRNMKADRAALATNAPIKRLSTSIWDPQAEPWGPLAIITVHDHKDVEPVSVPDVPNSMMEWEARILEAAERMAGMNDVALGQTPTESRTLGETQLVTEQSFVRQEERIRNLQETMETLFQVRHWLWVRALEQGAVVEAPDTFIRTLEYRGMQLTNAGGVTADDLRGLFRGKPRGSVETADKSRLRADYNEFLTVLGGLTKMWPPLAQVVVTPKAMAELLDQAMRLYNVGDRSTFLQPLKQMAMQMAMMPPPGMMLPPGMAPPPGPPGMPPGPPGPPPGPDMMGPPMGPPPGTPMPAPPPNAAMPMDPMQLAMLMGGAGQPDPRMPS